MHLRSLYLKNFRIYEEAQFEFEPHVNLIVGPNAQGKTSIIEALYVLMTGRSFRTSHVHDLIRQGASHFFIEATFVKYGLEQRLKMWFDGSERKIQYNTTFYPSVASLLGVLQGVVMSPDDVTLVKGQPAMRRHFLDLQIAQVDPLYVHHLTRFNRALRQRNALLRAKKGETLESWEHELAVSASYLVRLRYQTAEELQRLAQNLHATLTADVTPFKLSYHSSAPADSTQQQSYFHEQFKKLRKREMELGFTLVGPHKDDLAIALQNKDVRHFASEGQQRSCVAALKLAEWERMRTQADEVPIMMIDDVGTSLDESRRERLLHHVETLGQVFLTATHDFGQTKVNRILLKN